jgi:hypothetical protein
LSSESTDDLFSNVDDDVDVVIVVSISVVLSVDRSSNDSSSSMSKLVSSVGGGLVDSPFPGIGTSSAKK